MRIVLATNNDDDVYCFRLELIQRLISDGHELIVSCPDGPKFELLKDMPFFHDDCEIDRRGTNVFHDLKLALHYFKLFRHHKPEVVLTYTAKPNVYAGLVAQLLGIPYICNVTGLGSVTQKKGFIQSFIMWLFSMAYRGAACVMFQNSTNLQLAEHKHMVKGRRKLIPGSGVDINRFPLQSYPEGGNGLDGEIVVFNYIGRILHDKGVDDYIEIAKRIKKKYPCTEFNMIGFVEPTESHYFEELEILAQSGIVNYRGSQKDVRPWIARSHAIIHPSTYGEGMSNVLLENASSGRVLITTDNPGCRETVIDGISGYIYHGGDVDELEKKVELFLHLNQQQRRNMGASGRKHVSEKFSRDIVIEAYRDEIQHILEEKR